MRPILEMDNTQIEVTNACHLNCSNCTRFCNHHLKPYMMDFEQVKVAIDSHANWPKMVGIMGGEPLLHPQFPQICEYALSKIPRERLGLWSSFPDNRKQYAELIAKTFGNVFINDHTRPDIYHAPILIGIQELVKEPWEMWGPIHHCWLQNSWSASINPYGAYFCEIAAAMAILFNEPEDAWPVEDGWWKRTPKDYVAQMERFCPRCGIAAPLKRRRSVDIVDDISPLNYEALKDKSRKIKKDQFVKSLGQVMPQDQLEPMASYKDMDYRQRIAARYGLYLTLTQKGYWEPHVGQPRRSLFTAYREQYAG